MDCSPPGSSVHGDSPGKNTAVGFHALIQGIFPTQELNPGPLHWEFGVLVTGAVLSHSVLSSSVHGDSPGKNTAVGCHSLLQGIFPTQKLNPGLHIAGGFFTL